MSGRNILIVEDDPFTMGGLSEHLELAGYKIAKAFDGQAAIDYLQTQKPDLIILDLGLPRVSGIEVLEWLRARDPLLPVIILTGQDEIDKKERGLYMGADDYLIKPIDIRELKARLIATLRRARLSFAPKQDKPGEFRSGPLRIDYFRREVFLQGVEIRISPLYFKLLKLLADHANHFLPHDQILIEVWGEEYQEDIYLLRSAIYRLRKKIEPDYLKINLIENQPGVGYRLIGYN